MSTKAPIDHPEGSSQSEPAEAPGGRVEQAMTAVIRKTDDVVGSRVTTWVVAALFALQASWVALSSRSSVYDEGTHVNSIIAFAKRWSPLIDQAPSEAPLGDIERDGTFFYYFLLSWPWRVMEGLGISHDDAVLVLRFTSVAAVTAGLLIFASVMRQLGASRHLANFALFLVSMFPLLVFVAGAVNYDNLVFLLLAGLVWTFLRAYRSPELDLGALIASIALAGVTVITKFSAAPFLAVLAVLLLIKCGPQLWHERSMPWRSYFLHGPWTVRTRRWTLGVVTLAVVLLVLERYVGNLLHFGTPLPGCDVVHSVDFCENNSIYVRNQEALEVHNPVPMTLAGASTFFMTQWSVLMWRYLTLTGVHTADGPVLVLGPGTSGAIVLYGSIALVVLLIVCVPAISKTKGIVPILAACIGYVVVLFAKNYSLYAGLGVPYAVQGRYVLILLPWLVGIGLLGVATVIRQYSVLGRFLTYVVATVSIAVALTQGGGLLLYLWAAEPAWITDRWQVVQDLSRWGHELARGLIVDKVVIPDPR